MEYCETTIFTQSNFSDYKALINKYDLDLDIYYHPEFLKLEAQNMGGEFEIFTSTQSGKNRVFIYPYIKVSFSGDFSSFFDLVSPYGYAGPYCNDNSFFSKGENEFIKYVQTQNVVTEFVRYHFIYNKEQKFSKNIKTELNRTLIVIDLSKTWEDIWMKEMSMNNRNYVRKMEKEGYIFEINHSSQIIEEFIKLYYQTMDYTNADKYYYFNKEYFYQLFRALKGKVKLARIIKDDITYSTVFFFIGGKILHLYLMGRNFGYPKVPATNLLYTRIAEWAKGQGVMLLNIGGGITNSENDPLFKFKKNFSKQTRLFYIGKRIHQKAIYQQIVDKFIAQYGKEKYKKVKHILQFYRIPEFI